MLRHPSKRSLYLARVTPMDIASSHIRARIGYGATIDQWVTVSMSNDELAPQLDLYVQAVLGRKAESVVVLDVHDLTSIGDVFIICSGRSNRQVSAIADHINRSLKEKGIRPLSIEGRKEGLWVLMDYGSVIIHVFYEETRSFYDLEGLWVDAKRLTTSSLEQYKQSTAEPFDGEEIIVD